MKDVHDLRAVIEKHATAPQLLPVMQQITDSLGITSVEEWTKALEDKNVAAPFSHKSTPTPAMFVYAQTLIQKAKQRVIAHFRNSTSTTSRWLEECSPSDHRTDHTVCKLLKRWWAL